MKIILYIFLIAMGIQLIYWGVIFMRLAFYQFKMPANIAQIPVSVVICAKNEASNLKKNLPAILEQAYGNFEVLLVDDDSNDETQEVLATIKQQYPDRLRIISTKGIKRAFKGKKHALSIGIEASLHETLLLTDADCYPKSKEWIQIMVCAKADKKIGLAYGPYERHPGLLNKFIRYETVYTAVQYFGLAIWGHPYMGVGRNLIYDKALYKQSTGFKEHGDVASGDDDLFIKNVASSDNVKLIIEKKTYIYSKPKLNFSDFSRQKMRHLSTGRYYSTKHKLLLGALSMSHFVVFLAFPILVILNLGTVLAMTLFIMRTIIVLLLYKKLLELFDERDLWWWIPILDGMMVFYYFMFAPNLILKSKKWD